MKAILLAGGRGSRLGILTESRPKPLVEVLGKPILEHLIRNASAAGIKDYVISTGYLGSMIQDYFGNGSSFGVTIHYAESKGKGPEHPIFTARDYLDDGTFYCFCGDTILLPSNIERLITSHSQRSADATFTLEQGESQSIKRVKVEGDRIVGSSASIRDPVLVYTMAMQTAFLDVLYETVKNREDKAFAFVMDDLANTHGVYAIDIPFININTPEDVHHAESMLRGGLNEH